MKKKKVIGLTAIVLSSLVLGGAFTLKPILEHKLSEIAKVKINEEINGSVAYSSIAIDYGGNLNLKNVEVKDRHNLLVASAKTLSLDFSYAAIWNAFWNDEPPAEIIKKVQLEDLHLNIKKVNATTYNVEDLIKTSPDSEQKKFTYKGSIVIKNGSADIAGEHKIKLTKVDAAINFAEYPAAQLKFAGELNDQKIEVKGSLGLAKGNKYLNILAKVDKVNLHRLSFGYPLKGLLTSDISITGTLENPEIKGLVTVKDFAYDRQKLNYATSNIDYRNGVLTFTDLRLNDGGGDLIANGWFNTANMAYEALGKLNRVEIQPWANLAGYRATGVVNGVFALKGTAANIESLQAQINDSSFGYEDYNFSNINAKLNYDGDKIKLPYFMGNYGKGYFTGFGLAAKNELNMQLYGNDIAVDDLTKHLELAGKGAIDFAANVQGSLANPQIDIDISSKQAAIKGVNFDSITAKLGVKDDTINIDTALVNVGAGRYVANGIIGLKANSSINLNVEAEDVRAESILKPLADIDVTGWVNNKTHVTGTWQKPIIRGEINLRSGSAYGQLIQEASANYSYQDELALIDNINVNIYDAIITGQGRVRGETLDFNVQGRQLDLGRFLQNTNLNVNGYVDIEGKIGGTLSNPNIQGQAVAKTLSINNESLHNVIGEIYVDKRMANLLNFSFNQYPGSYVIRGNIYFANQAVNGTINAENSPVDHLVNLFNIPIHNLGGNLTGAIDVLGTLKDPNIRVIGGIENTTVLGEIMGNSQVDLSLQGRNFHIKKLRIPFKDGFIAAQGEAVINGDAKLQAAARDVPIKYALALFGSEYPVSGTMDGIVNITGKTKSPTMQISSTLNNVAYNDAYLDHVYILATMKDGLIDVNQILAERGVYKAKIYGKIPLVALYKDAEAVDKDNYLDLKIDLQNTDLDALPLFVPFVKSGSGKTTGLLNLTGVASDIIVNGNIQINNGTITFKDVKEPLTAINGKLNFQGHNAKLDLSANMGNGSAKLNGLAEWSNNQLQNYDFGLNMNDFAIASTYFNGDVNADLKLTHTQEGPLLAGVLDIDNSSIYVPTTFGDSNSNFDALVDLTIKAPTKLRVYNSLLYDFNIRGQTRFSNKLSSLRSEGKFSVVDGTIKYLNNRFEVSEGVAEFNDPSTFWPIINLKANTQVNAYKINLGLNGPLDNMNLSLKSEPALSEQQIFTLLTARVLNLGQNGGEYNALNSLLTAGLQMTLLGDVESTFKRYLGVDKFMITPTYLDPYDTKIVNKDNEQTQLNYYTLEVGKRVFPNLTLTFGTGLNYNLSKFGLDYKLTKHIDFAAWQTTNKNSFIGLNFKYRF